MNSVYVKFVGHNLKFSHINECFMQSTQHYSIRIRLHVSAKNDEPLSVLITRTYTGGEILQLYFNFRISAFTN